MASQKQSTPIVSPHRKLESPEQIAAFWTEERRRAAKPFPLPRHKGTTLPKHPVKEPGAHGSTKHDFGKLGATPHNGIQPHAGSAVPSPLNYPYRVCGKLFLTQGGQNLAGSAALVSPNILLTAGHCVYLNGAWSTNVAFYPSYPLRTGSDPLLTFSPSALGCWTTWQQSGDLSHDFGMAWFDSAPGNQLGWVGTCWNVPSANRNWEAVGYPGVPNPPYNGSAMDHAIGADGGSFLSGTFSLAGDDMANGSSGGPWLTNFGGESQFLHANGVSSWHDTDNNTIWSPYFTQDLNTLFNYIADPAHH